MESSIIHDVLGLLSTYRISATWAIVGRLCLSPCGPTVEQELFARLNGKDTLYQPNLWYARDLCIEIGRAEPRQEIACHSFSHHDWREISRSTAEDEIIRWKSAFDDICKDPISFVFPRNRVEHLDLISAHGFECFRDVTPSWQQKYRSLRLLTRFCQEFTENGETAQVMIHESGLKSIPGTLLWRRSRVRPGWRSSLRRAIKGLNLACSKGEVFHVWFHPVNLTDDYPEGLRAFEVFLQYADGLRNRGYLAIEPMDVSAKVINFKCGGV